MKNGDKVILTIGNKSSEYTVTLVIPNGSICLQDAYGRKDAYGRVRTASLWIDDDGYSFRTGNGQRKSFYGNVCVVRSLLAA